MLTLIKVIFVTAFVAIITAFILITRAENRYYEKRKRQGKPTPWI